MSLLNNKKNILILISIFTFVVITSLFLLLPAERQIAQKYNENILKKNINLSFQIPSPGKEQIKDLEANSDIEKIFPYYDLFTTLKLKRKTLSNFYTMMITNSQIDAFPFTQDKMIINKLNYSADEVIAFIDYSFAKDNNLKTGDKIDLSVGAKDINAVIGAVIINPGQFIHIRQGDGTEGSVIISIPDVTLQEISEGRIIQYGGAYIRSRNYDKTKEMLRAYKPYGRLKDRQLFPTQDEYQSYLDNFNKISYNAEIRDLKSELADSSPFPFTGILLLLFLITLQIILIIIICFNNTSTFGRACERIKNGEEIKDIIHPIKQNFISVLILNILLYTLFFIIFTATNRLYCQTGNYLLFFISFIVTMIILNILCLNLYLKFYKKRLSAV